MSWQYRVVREAGHLSIREVYDDASCTADACYPTGETINELSNDLMRMIKAFHLPILELRDNRLRQVSE